MRNDFDAVICHPIHILNYWIMDSFLGLNCIYYEFIPLYVVSASVHSW